MNRVHYTLVSAGWLGALTFSGGARAAAQDEGAESITRQGPSMIVEPSLRLPASELPPALSEFGDRLARARDDEQRRSVLGDLARATEELWATDLRRAPSAENKIGHQFFDLGDKARAMQSFQRVADQAHENPVARAEALRMLRLIHLSNDFPREALAVNARILEIYEAADSAVRRQLTLDYSQAILWAATIHEQLGEFAQAADRRRQFRELTPVLLTSESERRNSLRELAQDLLHAGRMKESLAVFDEFLAEYPDYGRENGEIIQVQRARLEARGLREGSPEHLAGLEAIWSNPEYRGHVPSISRFGISLAAEYARAGRPDDTRRILQEVDLSIAARLARPESLTKADADELRALHADALGRSAFLAINTGRFQEAKQTYDRLLETYPDCPDAANARRNRDLAEARLNKRGS